MNGKVKKTPPRVLMITGSYPPEITGGGLQCRNLIRACDKSGERFSVITTTHDRKLKYRDRVDNTPVYRLGIIPGNKFITAITWLIRLPWLASHVIAETDIVHLHGFSSKSYLFIALAKHYGKRIVMKITSLGEDDPTTVFDNKGMQKNFYEFIDRFVVPSEALAESCRNASLNNFELIPNGVDTERFKPAGDEKNALRAKLGLPQDGLIVIFVGHFSRDKRPSLAVRAWSTLEKSDDNVHLLMIGARNKNRYEVDSDEVKAVDKLAKGGTLPGELIFVEATDSVEDYYRSADIYLSTSVREGQPNALLEAMACGLACIQTRLPGITDNLLEETGELFEIDSEKELKSVLQNLVEDESLRKEKGKKTLNRLIFSGLTIEETAKKHEKLWSDLLSKKPIRRQK